MNHERCRELLLDLLCGELPSREARAMEHHLRSCEACRAERDRLQAPLLAMRQLAPPSPPPEDGDRLLIAAARKGAEDRRPEGLARLFWGFGLKGIASAALAITVILVGVQVSRTVRTVPERELVAHAPLPMERLEEKRETASSSSPEGTLAPAPSSHGLGAGETLASRGAVRAKERPARPEGELLARGQSVMEERRAARPAPAGPSAVGPRVAMKGKAEAEAKQAPVISPSEPLAMAPAPAPAAAPQADRVERSAEAASAGRGERLAYKLRRSRVALRFAFEPASPVAREIEMRVEAGRLTRAQKELEPCPGGDLRRTAWMDSERRTLALVRERSDGDVVGEWFDETGRLREAVILVPSGGERSGWRVIVDEKGAERVEPIGAPGRGRPMPPLVRRDPTGAFLAGPGCAR